MTPNITTFSLAITIVGLLGGARAVVQQGGETERAITVDEATAIEGSLLASGKVEALAGAYPGFDAGFDSVIDVEIEQTITTQHDDDDTRVTTIRDTYLVNFTDDQSMEDAARVELAMALFGG